MSSWVATHASGAPIVAMLQLSGEGVLISLGVNLLLLLGLLARVINTNFRYFVDLIRVQASLAEEGVRARAAERRAIEERVMAQAFAEDFDTAPVCNLRKNHKPVTQRP
ncbi:putative signal transduction protein with EAL and GGDEF domain [Bradyrhizobium sp. S3.12.5]|uniref:hypothetical protein n=1 Tax=Bradyrhizobium sp. S3.12.5 TaxID=3156386 RepID=UPI00339A9DDC